MYIYINIYVYMYTRWYSELANYITKRNGIRDVGPSS